MNSENKTKKGNFPKQQNAKGKAQQGAKQPKKPQTTRPQQNHGAAPSSNAAQHASQGLGGVKQFEQKFLRFFWDLAAVEARLRLDTVAKLVNYLSERQQGKQDDKWKNGLCPELAYAVNRLVKGLASSHDAARQGFTLALAQCLDTFPCVTVELLLSVAEDALKAHASMTPAEKRDVYFGKIFLFGVVCRSSQLAKVSATTEQGAAIKKMVSDICYIFSIKSFFHEACCKILTDLIERLPVGAVEGCFITPAKSIFMDPVSVEALDLALKLEAKGGLKVFEGRQWSTPLLSKGNVEKICEILKTTKTTLPQLHSVWATLLAGMNGKEKSKQEFAKAFWEALDNSLAQANEYRITEAFIVRLEAVKLLPVELTAAVVSPKFLAEADKLLKNTGSVNYPSAQHFVKEIAKCTDAAKAAVIIKAVMDGDRLFALARLVTALLRNVSAKEVKALRDRVMKRVAAAAKEAAEQQKKNGTAQDGKKKEKTDEEEEEEEEEEANTDEEKKKKKKADKRSKNTAKCAELHFLLQILSDWELVKALATQGDKAYDAAVIETVTFILSCGSYYKDMDFELPENMRKMCVMHGSILLARLALFNGKHESADKDVHFNGVDSTGKFWIESIVAALSSKLDKKNKVYTVTQQTAKDIDTQLKERVDASLSKFLQGLKLTLNCAVLALDVNSEDTQELVEDFAEVYKVLGKGKKAFSTELSNDEETAVSVFIDALLSLLSRPSKMLSEVVKAAFKTILPVITKEGIKTLFDAIQDNDDDEEEEEEEEEEDDDNDDEDDENEEDEKEDEKEDESDDDNKKDNTSEIEEENNKNTKEEEKEEEKPTKKVSDKKAEDEDEENDSDADMDNPKNQEALNELDRRMEKMFSEMKKEKKAKLESKYTKQSFKTKACTLLEDVFSEISCDKRVELLELTFDTIKAEAGNKEFVKRLTKAFNETLCRPKVYNLTNAEPANKVLSDFLDKVRTSGKESSLVINACIFLMKALIALPNAAPREQQKKADKKENQKQKEGAEQHEKDDDKKEKSEGKNEGADGNAAGEKKDGEETSKEKKKKKDPNTTIFLLNDGIYPELHYGAVDIWKVKGALLFFLHKIFNAAHGMYWGIYEQIITRVPTVAWLAYNLIISTLKKIQDPQKKIRAFILIHKLLARTKALPELSAALPWAAKLTAQALPAALHNTTRPKVVTWFTRTVKFFENEAGFKEALASSAALEKQLAQCTKRLDRNSRQAFYNFVVSYGGDVSKFPKVAEMGLSKKERQQLKRQHEESNAAAQEKEHDVPAAKKVKKEKEQQEQQEQEDNKKETKEQNKNKKDKTGKKEEQEDSKKMKKEKQKAAKKEEKEEKKGKKEEKKAKTEHKQKAAEKKNKKEEEEQDEEEQENDFEDLKDEDLSENEIEDSVEMSDDDDDDDDDESSSVDEESVKKVEGKGQKKHKEETGKKDKTKDKKKDKKKDTSVKGKDKKKQKDSTENDALAKKQKAKQVQRQHAKENENTVFGKKRKRDDKDEANKKAKLDKQEKAKRLGAKRQAKEQKRKEKKAQEKRQKKASKK